MLVHIRAEELADATAGLLATERAAEVAAHLRDCAACRATEAGLRQVEHRLATVPAPAMPATVAARLATVVATESARRATAGSPLAAAAGRPEPAGGARAGRGSDRPGPGWLRPVLGELNFPSVRARRWAMGLAAVAAATVIGAATYVVSASAGLNEPPVARVAVDSGQLGRQAGTIAGTRDLDPHRFSQAWNCARTVTGGRITGLTTATVDGREALLVFTREDNVAWVTVVTGCEADRPVAGTRTRVVAR